MSEVRRDMKPVEVDQLCDKCKIGHMRPVPSVSPFSYRAPFPHICSQPSCRERQDYDRIYPYIEFEVK